MQKNMPRAKIFKAQKCALLLVLLCCTLFSACAYKKPSMLSIGADEKELGLIALNKNAFDAKIDNPKKTPYAYFAFEDALKIGAQDKSKSVQLLIKLDADDGILANATNANGANANKRFLFGFLYADDFTSTQKLTLKKTIAERAFVSGTFSGEGSFLVSFELPRDKAVYGFVLYSEAALSVENCAIVDAKTGWLLQGTLPWFGFGANGGTIRSKTPSYPVQNAKTAKITLYLHQFDATNANNIIVTTSANADGVKIRQAPNQKTITLYGKCFNFDANPAITVQDGFGAIDGIVIEDEPTYTAQNSTSDANASATNATATTGATNLTGAPATPATPAPSLKALVTDPGLILDFSPSLWRRSDFELFAWEQFPSVLFFDTKNYAIQDLFFKRLAFFAEKGGWRGKLAPDSAIQYQHGFNAHDYRAETLAEFFELARLTTFPLNEYEVLLCNILIEHGIINVRKDGSFGAGLGSLVSISQESSRYLRNRFIPHEGLHCLYFGDEAFRMTVRDVYNATDKESLRFLTQYFSVTASLNYDLSDTYLIQNEFMAYMLQQPLSEVAEYFTKILATKKTINKTNPELVDYLLQTNAQAFVQAARTLDAYLFERWGYNSGRIALVTSLH